MRFTTYLAGAVLTALAPAALAQAPFQFNGLHPDLVFTDAVATTEKLGGKCRVKHSRTEGGGVGAQCELPSGSAGAQPGDSGKRDATEPTPSIASQPITRIGMEAPVETAQLTRIVFVFDGSLDTVAEYLVQQFGQPDHDGTSAAEKSWSHAKRRSWSQGHYTLGLSNSPDLVILTVNRPPSDPGES